MTFVPSPINHWHELTASNTAVALALTVFYEAADGSVIATDDRGQILSHVELIPTDVSGEIVMVPRDGISVPLRSAILPSTDVITY